LWSFGIPCGILIDESSTPTYHPQKCQQFLPRVFFYLLKYPLMVTSFDVYNQWYYIFRHI
jgi:hypothetical protein